MHIWGKKHEASGSSVAEAVTALTVPNPKGKSVLVIEHGDTKRERVLTPIATARLFSHGLTREVTIKNTSLLFDL